MKATFEISLYPLQDDYKNIVLRFLEDLNKYPHIRVETNGMSTQVFGELNELFRIMQELCGKYLDQYQAVLVFKVGKGHLRYEKA
jgi:uncharacterized protein YqgV (UPF0045/DUF77 family)